MKVAQVK